MPLSIGFVLRSDSFSLILSAWQSIGLFLWVATLRYSTNAEHYGLVVFKAFGKLYIFNQFNHLACRRSPFELFLGPDL